MQNDSSAWVVLAHLLRPQGRKGELLAELFTDFPEQLQGRENVFLVSTDSPEERKDARPVEILSAWLPVGRNQGRVVLQLAGIETISAAETVAGLDVVVPENLRLPLEDESIYVSDLVGYDVFDNIVPLGKVTEVSFPVEPDGARILDMAPLLVIQGEGENEILVPFVKAFIVHMDQPDRKLIMNLPAGLVDINRKS
jgi:16S rRNA processing protein RimM